MGFELWKSIKHNKRIYSIALLLYAGLSVVLHFLWKLLEDAFYNWVNIYIAEKWLSKMSITGNLIEWGIPILVALLLLILIFYIGRRFERKKTQKKEPEEVEEAPIFEIEVPEDKLHKVVGIPLPEGRTLDIKGKWVKRKIQK